MICLLLTSKILSGHFSFPQEANPSLRCRQSKSSWPSSSTTTTTTTVAFLTPPPAPSSSSWISRSGSFSRHRRRRRRQRCRLRPLVPPLPKNLSPSLATSFGSEKPFTACRIRRRLPPPPRLPKISPAVFFVPNESRIGPTRDVWSFACGLSLCSFQNRRHPGGCLQLAGRPPARPLAHPTT